MKKSIILTFIFTLLLAVGCSKDSLISSTSDDTKGSVLLNIDKANAPSDVVALIANLTRENYKTLTGYLNLLSDSSADISFQSISAGTWHLKIDAYNKDSIIIYSGESNVEIQGNVLTQVSLTLIPTTNGTGNVHISVTWGSNENSGWVDYNLNPIFSPFQNPNKPNSVLHPKVFYEDGRYKMWYTNLYNSAVTDIWYTESTDGINWTNQDTVPALSYGMYGDWYYMHIQCGAVIKDANEYKMYFFGFTDQYGYWNIGLSTSSDGKNWEKYPSPILYAGSQNQIWPTDVIKIDNKYYLYYSSRIYPYYDIRLAISEDGINFVQYQGNPILIANKNWESTGVANASIMYDNNQYKMVYMNSLGNAFGIAVSNNGINWEKKSDNPFFKLSEVSNKQCQKILYPFWRKYNGKYRVYYTGLFNGDTEAIGMIYKK